ncbi:MAG TPA: FtsX-like permease family protein, partial [Vicinamibacterales bacterium]|nr:FtsX-like permease family protein [Vicinamibacterales bacterium]
GGTQGDLFRLVVGQGMAIVAVGVLTGLLVSMAATRAMASLLFGVSSADPRTFVTAAAILGTVALVACTLPAGRATRVQPASVLRDE